MKTVRLHEFVHFLSLQTRVSFQNRGVDLYLASHQVELDDLLDYTRFREDRFARNLIHRTDLYELFVLAWLPGQFAPVHNHNGQRCWMAVASGTLTLQDYSPVDSDEDVPFPKALAKEFNPGDQTYIDDGVGLHSIHNKHSKPAISMHLHAGPIRICKVFDADKGCFKQVELRYFPPPFETQWHPAHPSDPELPESSN